MLGIAAAHELAERLESHIKTKESDILGSDAGIKQNANPHSVLESFGEPAGTRTRDHRIQSSLALINRTITAQTLVESLCLTWP